MNYRVKNLTNLVLLLLLGSWLPGCGQDRATGIQAPPKAARPEPLHPATIYFGGDIVTMEGDSPQYVEALVEREGRIVFVGDKDAAMERFGGDVLEHDLGGKTLLPGFVDGHGHFFNTGFSSLMANVLPPPDGPGQNFDSLVNTTKAWMESDNGRYIIDKLGWVLANGYDDSQLAENEHPTADVLDRISTELPVLFMHQSGHLAVVNHKGLEFAEYTKDTPNPAGGFIRRDANGDPNGVLEEQAFFTIALGAVAPDEEIQVRAVESAVALYASQGYTTAQDGRSTEQDSAALEAAARNGSLTLDVVSYPDIIWNVEAARGEFYNREQRYTNHFRVGGVKLTFDGSPQGKTAWLTEPYLVPPEGKDEDYRGYPSLTEEDASKWMSMAFENRWQILAHTNGDAAIDQYLRAMRNAQEEHNYEDHRAVLIHAQTLRADQIPALVELGVYPSFYSAHTFYWGDWHVSSVLGHPRADYISPARDAIDAGLTITSHTDAPVIPPVALRVLDATVNRVTRSGYILGPDQRISVYEGLLALTQWAARQYFEEDTKGTLTVGKLADFVILEQNPLKIDPMNIHTISVVETIKEGQTIYDAGASAD